MAQRIRLAMQERGPEFGSQQPHLNKARYGSLPPVSTALWGKGDEGLLDCQPTVKFVTNEKMQTVTEWGQMLSGLCLCTQDLYIHVHIHHSHTQQCSHIHTNL